jgi:transcriptional regulator with XRE-family HTH domain
MDTHAVGEKIYLLRKKRNMTQQQLADEIYVTNKAISKWESGIGMPDIAILPSLASALGVTVDDLMSNNDMPVNKEFNAKRFTAWMRTKRAKVIACTVAAALVLTFGVINILWFRYIDHTFSPYLQNEKLASNFIRENGWTIYQYNDFDNGYVIQLRKPPYLKLGGSISIHAMAESVTGFSLSDFTVAYKSCMGRIQQRHELGLGAMWHGRSHAIDRYGFPLPQNPVNSGEAYERWLSMYAEHFDEIMTMIAYFNDFFAN